MGHYASPKLYLLVLFNQFSWCQRGAVSLCKRRGGEDGREQEKVCSLWIAQTIPAIPNIWASGLSLIWAGITKKIIAVWFQLWIWVIILFNSQTKCVHCTKCTEKLKAASNTILASCSQVCSRVFGGRGMNLIACNANEVYHSCFLRYYL